MIPQNGIRTLAIRADADGLMGTGHVMRCLALAQEWRRRGGEVVFLGRIGAEQLRQRIAAEGCRLEPWPAAHPDPRDGQVLTAWLGERAGQGGWLVLDGYHFDLGYQQAIRACGWSLLVLDDYRHLSEYVAEILLNPNAYAGALYYRTNAECLHLLGSRYAPLRREFREAAGNAFAAEERGLGRRILVTMGGADPDNVSGRVVEALLAMGRSDIEVKLVAGALNPHRQRLAEQLRRAPFVAELLDPVDNMATLMQWSTFTISGAGSTCWELAALGVPVVATVIAENQERVAAVLAEAGAAVNLGWHGEWRVERAAKVLAELLADPRQLQSMSRRGRALVDGRGCERLARAMAGYHFTWRLASGEDRELVFRWANDPVARAASFSPGAISWEEHCRWFAGRLADPGHLFYLALTEGGDPLAQVRFSLAGGGTAEISVSLAPEYRGVGLGSRLIRSACRQAMAEKAVTIVRALVKQDNVSSLQAFVQAGFRPAGAVECAGQAAQALEYLREEGG